MISIQETRLALVQCQNGHIQYRGETGTIVPTRANPRRSHIRTLVPGRGPHHLNSIGHNEVSEFGVILLQGGFKITRD